MLDLFADAEPRQEPLAHGAVILRRFALSGPRRCWPGSMTSRPFRHSDIW